MYLKKENAVAAGKKIKPKSQTWNVFIYFFYLKKKLVGGWKKGGSATGGGTRVYEIREP